MVCIFFSIKDENVFVEEKSNFSAPTERGEEKEGRRKREEREERSDPLYEGHEDDFKS